ncbi:SigE family RNA polymerase sigma factor [Phytohabitans kaempferiae]|uniref:SigE family RNA polymerase sigma factor n=1 Tax=Phytohabitans kaempferiae TaxID=1620943 RepID=A0ABV6M2Q5_9ACTN
MISFEEFVTARGPALLRFGYLMCGDRHLAEDILQEVLAKVYRRWGRIARAEPPEAYVRRALLHQYLSWRRRRSSTEAVVPAVPESADLAVLAEQVAARDEMWALLATLPRVQRAVLVLRYYLDLPDAEIADLVGCAPATVRVHAFRALGTLRATLSTVTSEARSG